MPNLNRVQLMGYLGASPDCRTLENGADVASFRIATNERWNDEHGERHERTEWHTVVAWGRLAASCGKYLKKGALVYLEGKLRTRSWEDDSGVKHYATEVIARSVQFLNRRDKSTVDADADAEAGAPA